MSRTGPDSIIGYAAIPHAGVRATRGVIGVAKNN
jgi:hypothetical protein